MDMLKNALLGLVMGLSVAGADPSFRYDRPTIKTVVSHGDPSRKVDLVFLGDGYTPREASEFDRDVREACQSLWQYPFFKDYKDHFNVHSAFVPSETIPSRMVYAFGSVLSDPLSGVVSISKEKEVLQVAQQAPGCDVVIVFTTLSGRANCGSIITLPNRGFSALPHELGHKIGKLGDEYNSTSSQIDREQHALVGQDDLDYPNLTRNRFIDPSSRASLRKTAKWGHFIDLPGADPLVGAMEGGYYRGREVWRPSVGCIMGGKSGAFCPVCHEEMVKQVYAICGIPFDDTAHHRKHPLSQWKLTTFP